MTPSPNEHGASIVGAITQAVSVEHAALGSIVAVYYFHKSHSKASKEGVESSNKESVEVSVE